MLPGNGREGIGDDKKKTKKNSGKGKTTRRKREINRTRGNRDGKMEERQKGEGVKR